MAVLITGISGNLGRVIAKILHRGEKVIGLDRRPFPGAPKDLEVHHLDVRKRKVEDLFEKFEADLKTMYPGLENTYWRRRHLVHRGLGRRLVRTSRTTHRALGLDRRRHWQGSFPHYWVQH